MENTYKPKGYNSLSPYLIVNGAQKMIDLLTKIFDAKVLRKYSNDDGSIMHAEIQIDDSVLMIGDSNDRYPPNNLLLHVYVPNVGDVFLKAVSLGCEVIESPVQNYGDPDIRGQFKDFQGNIWAIGTQI